MIDIPSSGKQIDRNYEELEILCASPKNSGKSLFWRSEMYGMGSMYRKYGYFPSKWPLNIYSAHGVHLGNGPAKHELENQAPVMVYNTKRYVEAFKKLSNQPCYCVISPFAFYRKINNIKQNPDAKGTIVYVGHSTHGIDDLLEMNEYKNQLNNLPEKYKPLTICLHSNDIQKGLHNFFLEHGFKVVTAGHPLRRDYTKRFYDILCSHKYATSNFIGSYAFYAIDLGIPFFLYGSEPVLYNKSDENIEKGLYNSYKSWPRFILANQLFKTSTGKVTQEQISFVREELGYGQSVSRIKFSFILYYCFLQFWKNKEGGFLLSRFARRLIRNILS